jgi:hypothetical protein
MPEIATVEQEPDSGYLRLEQQIAWYDRKSGSAQRCHKRLKIAEISLAALVPLLANVNAIVTGICGVVVVVLEALQQTNQWHANWITYRSTCEALRHEKYSYLGKTGVYEEKTDDEAKRVLVQRIEALISTEHAKWISRQEYETKKMHRVDQ